VITLRLNATVGHNVGYEDIHRASRSMYVLISYCISCNSQEVSEHLISRVTETWPAALPQVQTVQT
jgi:hypothetical protein